MEVPISEREDGGSSGANSQTAPHEDCLWVMTPDSVALLLDCVSAYGPTVKGIKEVSEEQNSILVYS